MIKEETRQGASNLMEGMTSVSALFAAKAEGVNDRPILEIRFDKAKKEKKAREFAFLARKCKELDIPLTLTDAAELEKICIGNTHGGIIAICGDRTIPLPCAENLPKSGFLCLLEGIEDPYNFGYTVRSLYAAGVDGVILPPRNWMGVAGLVARSSAGTSEKMPLFVAEPAEVIPLFKAKGYRAACAEIRDSVDLYEADLTLPLLLVIGGEKRGISRAVLSEADLNVRIGYYGSFRGSLSSAASAAVLAFEVGRQNSTHGAVLE